MCLFYAEAFFHPFHFAKLSSWRLFPSLSFFPLRLYRLVYAFTRAVKRLPFAFSRLLLQADAFFDGLGVLCDLQRARDLSDVHTMPRAYLSH